MAARKDEASPPDRTGAGARPLVVGLLLDAQSAFGQIAGALSEDHSPIEALNHPGWVIAHTAFFHDCWMNGDAQGRPKGEWDAWLLDWAERQREAGRTVPIPTALDEALSAWRRILPPATEFLSGLTSASLDEVPSYEEGAWAPGTTVGYLVARAIAHLFSHAAELNVIATAQGLPDAGLPGRLSATRG